MQIHLPSSYRRMRRIVMQALTAVVLLAAAACSSTRHVPDGQYLVDKVDIRISDRNDISTSELSNYLRQTPNHKALGFMRLQLATYNMSGRDTTKWFNRFVRKIGRPPVIYDRTLTEASAAQLRQALVNRGYLDTSVEIDTILNARKKKARVSYIITAGQPHYISTIDYVIPDTAVAAIVRAQHTALPVQPGDLLDRNRLEKERTDITRTLRDKGYFAFTKDYISFTADTAANAKDVNLTLNLRSPGQEGSVSQTAHSTYRIRRVVFVTDYNPASDYGRTDIVRQDSADYRGITVLYGPDRYISPRTLYEACYLHSGQTYSQQDVDNTYQALGRFGILRYVNIDMRPVADSGDGRGPRLLDAYILLTRGKKQGVSVELEGTNSEGDLGFGAGITYQHRNLAHGAEMLTAKFRGSYESLSGDFSGFINHRYMEYASEIGITFPKFKAPFLSAAFKRRMKATTEFSVSFNYQERPEYTRIIAGAAWRYRWSNPSNTLRHRFDLLDVNYVRLPKSTLNFIDQIAPSNPLLRYSYEDHFIMLMGYSYYASNKRQPGATHTTLLQPSVYTVRASVETAGNLLYLASKIGGADRHNEAYKVLGIQYAQYVKADADYTFTRNFSRRSSMALHAGAGICIPYGNSSMVPFEKRFYAGGANGVRGWGVRTLGPGRYSSSNYVSDFINQCGDIRLYLSAEFRQKLFWVLEGAFFVDAGNIWTIRTYENQPRGTFRPQSFYKELAASYGVGIRLDFNYFLLRLDLGIKAHNPAYGQEQWPIVHPDWNRDATFHFSVGYPF